MMYEQSSLVSIIIPTYNRADLIGETLNSLLAQTYLNWECIVVDDDSADNTEEVVRSYSTRDNRIKYYKRPNSKPKGGNACRNYGFEISKGAFVTWFDSDDLMLSSNLEVKMQLFCDFNYDFVISSSKRFYNNEISAAENSNNGNINLDLNLENFVMAKVFWLTVDIMYTRESIKNIVWNEQLFAGQEYNFICKYLSRNPRGYFVNQNLSLRRMHSNSIKAQRKNSLVNNRYMFYSKYQTFIELDTNSLVRKQILIIAISNYIRLQPTEVIANSLELAKSLYSIAGLFDVFIFYLMLTSRLVLNRHQRFYKILANRAQIS